MKMYNKLLKIKNCNCSFGFSFQRRVKDEEIDVFLYSFNSMNLIHLVSWSEGRGHVVFVVIVLPGGLDKRTLIHEPMLDPAFPEASADLLWISTRAARTPMLHCGDAQGRKELHLKLRFFTLKWSKVPQSRLYAEEAQASSLESSSRWRSKRVSRGPFEGARCHSGLCLSLV